MATSFARTLRSLEQVRMPPGWFALAFALLGVWSCWLFGSRVSVYAASSDARLEVSRDVARVSSPKSGRVIALALELGREVGADDVLLELDGSAEARRCAQLESELAGVQAQLATLGEQRAAEEQLQASSLRVSEIESERASLAAREAKRVAGHQARLADVANHLHERDIVSSLEAQQAEQLLAERSSAVRVAEQELRRLGAARHRDEDAARARAAALHGRATELEASARSARVQRAACEAELERYRIRAGSAGRLAGTAPIRVGDQLEEGAPIATVVPHGDVQVVGEFAASAAAGRIVPGQPARVRLSGFAWTDYGSLAATVARVASEPSRAGAIRVELALAGHALRGVPLQHGLPGSVEIQVESASPWSLLVRMFGESLAGAAASVSASDAAAPTAAAAAQRP